MRTRKEQTGAHVLMTILKASLSFEIDETSANNSIPLVILSNNSYAPYTKAELAKFVPIMSDINAVPEFFIIADPIP